MKMLVKWDHPESESSGVDFIEGSEFYSGKYEGTVNVLDFKDYPDHFGCFRVIVAGGRHFSDFPLLENSLNNVLKEKRKSNAIVIVSGGATGADRFGEMYAREQGFIVDKYPAQWDLHGKSAGYKRNVQMSENADALVAFWNGNSVGTKHMIDIAQKANLPTRVISYI